MKSEYLMLSQVYDPEKHFIHGWLASEKLDGHRALWIPSTRGRDDSSMATESGVATGLWSRYGKIIHAPDSWLDQLPKEICLDGELYNPALSRQSISSIVTRSVELVPWDQIQYWVFDSPETSVITQFRTIYKLGGVGCAYNFEHSAILTTRLAKLAPFYNDVVREVVQTELPRGPACAVMVDKLMKCIEDAGGEGLIVRDPWSPYVTERSWSMLKIKPRHDGHATIVGFTTGKGKYVTQVGALVVECQKPLKSGSRISWLSNETVRFELSGMKDSERRPGVLKVGQIVRFEFRTLSDDGVPVEAAYKGLADKGLTI